MNYKSWIADLRREFAGKSVIYQGKVYKITQVDYNGAIHIDLPSEFNKDTAVYWPFEARNNLVTEE